MSERLVLDSGAIIAWEHGETLIRAWITVALEQRAHMTVPAVVVVETTRGGLRDAQAN
ncbi:MAG: hypothetical protein ACRDZ4_17950 [Egibacteraceae bacterium]